LLIDSTISPFIPNLYINNEWIPFEADFFRLMVLVSTRDIKKGEELFSTYNELIDS
jgi:hypothetical protein